MSGKNKLARFEELDNFHHVLQPSKNEIQEGLKLSGQWNNEIFKNKNPIILELGCGRGEYSIEMAERNIDKNYIGIDIKGARIWHGAKKVVANKMKNVAFIRTRIEWLKHCFGPDEIDEIWLTFPDPQMKFQRAKHRLISPKFLLIYKSILKPSGFIHLKSDSEFLHGYLHGIIESSEFKVHESYHDIYNQLLDKPMHEALYLKTYYEKIWIKNNKPINYLKFSFK